MFFNLFIVSLVAAAAARTIPENCDSHFVPPPTDFPRRPPLRQTPEYRGTGVIDQGNGEAILQEKPEFDELRNRNSHRNHGKRRPIYPEPPNYFDNFGTGISGAHEISGPILQEKSNSDGLRLENDKDTTNDNTPPQGINIDNIGLTNASEHKNHNCIQRRLKADKNTTDKIDPQSALQSHTDSLDKNQPKNNIHSTKSKTSNDNEVILEGRTNDSNLPENESDDRWIWGDTTTTTLSPADLDNRAAFDGGKCPTGQTRIKGSDMCIDKDED